MNSNKEHLVCKISAPSIPEVFHFGNLAWLRSCFRAHKTKWGTVVVALVAVIVLLITDYTSAVFCVLSVIQLRH